MAIPNENGMEYRTTYKIVTWVTTAEWEDALNVMAANGWRVDTHKLNNDAGGCTIFVQTERVRTLLIDASIRCREIYSVVNSTEMYDLQQKEGNQAEAACQMICAKIKQVCEARDDR